MTAGVLTNTKPLAVFTTYVNNPTGTNVQELYNGPAVIDTQPRVGMFNFAPNTGLYQTHVRFPALASIVGLETVTVVVQFLQSVGPNFFIDIVEGDWTTDNDASAFLNVAQLQAKPVLGSFECVANTQSSAEVTLPASFFTVPRKLTFVHRSQRDNLSTPNANSLILWDGFGLQTKRLATGVNLIRPVNAFGVYTYNTNKASAGNGTGSRGTYKANRAGLTVDSDFEYEQGMMRFDTTTLSGLTGPATLYVPVSSNPLSIELELWAFNWTTDDNATAFYRNSQMTGSPLTTVTVPANAGFFEMPLSDFTLGGQTKWVLASKEQRTQAGPSTANILRTSLGSARLVYGTEIPQRKRYHYGYIIQPIQI